jgi:hypothetical protein
MRRGAGPRPRRHDAGHELKGGVPEAASGIAAGGEARLFSRSAEGSNHAGRVPRQSTEARQRQGARAWVDCVKDADRSRRQEHPILSGVDSMPVGEDTRTGTQPPRLAEASAIARAYWSGLAVSMEWSSPTARGPRSARGSFSDRTGLRASSSPGVNLQEGVTHARATRRSARR